ncbi:LytTR family transcriptional regulator DNA-binding domain-containing protein [Faecalibacillus intestinalis]
MHKSYIINKRFIQEIKNQEVILKEQTHLPIGRSYKESLKEQN